MQQAKKKIRCLINNIKESEDKIFEQDEFSKFVVQTAHKRRDLLDNVKVILQFSETIQPYLN